MTASEYRQFCRAAAPFVAAFAVIALLVAIVAVALLTPEPRMLFSQEVTICLELDPSFSMEPPFDYKPIRVCN